MLRFDKPGTQGYIRVMRKWLSQRGPAFWGTVSVVGTAVFTLVSLFASGVLTRRGGELRVAVLEHTELVNVDDLVAPQVEVRYVGQRISKLYLLSLSVQNRGNADIVEKSDVVDPLRIQLSGDTQLLGKPAVTENEADAVVSFELLEDDSGVQVGFDLLYAHSEFRMNILYTGVERATVSAHARIGYLANASGDVLIYDRTREKSRLPLEDVPSPLLFLWAIALVFLVPPLVDGFLLYLQESAPGRDALVYGLLNITLAFAGTGFLYWLCWHVTAPLQIRGLFSTTLACIIISGIILTTAAGSAVESARKVLSSKNVPNEKE